MTASNDHDVIKDIDCPCPEVSKLTKRVCSHKWMARGDVRTTELQLQAEKAVSQKMFFFSSEILIRRMESQNIWGENSVADKRQTTQSLV